MSLIIRNARVRGQKETVDIAIEGEKISAVVDHLPGGGGSEIDAGGNLVLPGLLRCQFHCIHCGQSIVVKSRVSNVSSELAENAARGLDQFSSTSFAG